jgi:hypothetical protein
MSNKKLYKYKDGSECYMLPLESLFIATGEEINKLSLVYSVCLGEIEGKHSEYYFYFNSKCLKEIEIDAQTLTYLEEAFPTRILSGIDIFDIIERFQEDLEELSYEEEVNDSSNPRYYN